MEEKRTQFAMQALGLAELFAIQFAGEKLTVGSKPRAHGALSSTSACYAIEIAAPEGLSTGGGKQAVQHVKLVPEQGGSTIVIGAVNQLEKTCELRTYEYLATVHSQRFKGAELPLHREKYNDVLARMQAFFVANGLRLIMSDAQHAPVPRQPQKKGGGGVIAAVSAVALVVIAALLYVVLHRGR